MKGELDLKSFTLTAGAVEVLGQLFVKGPTWDGDILSKMGRNELYDNGLIERMQGWNFLTRDGMQAAIEWDTKGKYDGRWYRKQKNLPEASPR